MERTLYFLKDKISGEFIINAQFALGKFEDAVILTSVKNTKFQLNKRNVQFGRNIIQTKELIDKCQNEDWSFFGMTSEDTEVQLWERLRICESIDLEIVAIKIQKKPIKDICVNCDQEKETHTICKDCIIKIVNENIKI